MVKGSPDKQPLAIEGAHVLQIEKLEKRVFDTNMLLKESKRLNSDLSERCEYLTSDHHSLTLTFTGYKKSQKELNHSYETEISCLKSESESLSTQLSLLSLTNLSLTQKLTDLSQATPNLPPYPSDPKSVFTSKPDQQTKAQITHLQEALSQKDVQ